MESQYYLKVPGAALTENEREYIKTIASSFKNETPIFFGIGVMRGGSFHCMRAGNKNAIIYGLDIDYKTKPIHRPDLINATWLTGDSQTFEFNQQIDFLFIDGDHHYNIVKNDIQNWFDRISINGVIMFHDYKPKKRDLGTMPWLDGVRQAVDEFNWDENYFYEIGKADSIIAFKREV